MFEFLKKEWKRFTSYVERDANRIWDRGNRDVDVLQGNTGKMIDVVKPPSPPSLDRFGEITMANEGDTYHVGQSAATGRYARSDNNTFIQSEQKQTLAEAAAEIQGLIKQLERTNPNVTEAEKVAYVNDETTPSFKRRVAGALQASGEAALDEFILENKYLKVAKAAAKGWMQPGF